MRAVLRYTVFVLFLYNYKLPVGRARRLSRI